MPEEAALRDAAASIGCTLNEIQIERLLAYVTLLLKWSRVYNLTAIRDRKQAIAHHLLDSLSVVAPLVRHTGRAPFDLLDVGSGAGLPGLVIGAVLGQARVTCIDAVAKKASFVQQAVSELGLNNVQAEHGRVERLTTRPFRIITARAFSSLDQLVTTTRRHLLPDGVWMAMKGRRPDDEIAALPPEIEAFHVEQLRVPGLEADRCLVWMRPTALPSALATRHP